GIVTEVIDRPVQQANIRLGFPTIPRLHPDYYPLLMLNYIFGASSLSSRIAVTVRDNQGLAYQVVSRYVPMRHLGIFTVILQTSNATANQALEGIRSEMVKIQQAEVEDVELNDARSHFRDRFPLTIETNGAMASQLLNLARYDLPLTHFKDHLDHIAAVTKADILRAAQQYFTPDKFVLTVVANAAEAEINVGNQVVGATV
ncbi:MAG: insulinase family protein, partial [bacterium]